MTRIGMLIPEITELEEQLFDAIDDNDIKQVKGLIAQEVNINAKECYEHRTPLHEAVDYGRLSLVKVLIAAGADLEALDYMGRTPLLVASDQGYLEIVKALIAAGADVNSVDDSGNTALDIARCHDWSSLTDQNSWVAIIEYLKQFELNEENK